MTRMHCRQAHDAPSTPYSGGEKNLPLWCLLSSVYPPILLAILIHRWEQGRQLAKAGPGSVIVYYTNRDLF